MPIHLQERSIPFTMASMGGKGVAVEGMKTLGLAVMMGLAGCASMGGSGATVQQIAKDSYDVRVLSKQSISAAKQLALEAANRHCRNEKHYVMLVDELAGIEEETGEKYYDVTFMCLNNGDADFIRVNRKTPTSKPSAPTPTEAE